LFATEGPSKLEKKRKAAGAQPAKEGDGLMRRRSPYKDTARLLAQLVLRKVSTLVFVKVRTYGRPKQITRAATVYTVICRWSSTGSF
jgi:ATP-dependent helicase YprA (DUF1998 family)